MSNGETDNLSEGMKSAINDSNSDEKLAGPEALLMDDPNPRTVAAIADEEVRVVNVKKSGNSISVILLLLLAVIAVAGGYYYLQQLTPIVASVAKIKPLVPVRMVVPSRVTVEPLVVDSDNVEEEVIETDQIMVVKENSAVDASLVNAVDSRIEPYLFTVLVGPFVHSDEVNSATQKLKDLGLRSQVQRENVPVTMVRLLEGIYSNEEVQFRYKILKEEIPSAFTLPENGKRAIYLGSFRQQWRAKSMQEELAVKNIKVELIPISVVMDGTMLAVLQADVKAANEVMAHIEALGYAARIEKKE